MTVRRMAVRLQLVHAAEDPVGRIAAVEGCVLFPAHLGWFAANVSFRFCVCFGCGSCVVAVDGRGMEGCLRRNL